MKSKLITPGEDQYQRGYYLKRKSDGALFFISAYVDVRALEKVADKHPGGKHGYQYSITHYWGLDVDGYDIWSTRDLTDVFI